MALLAQKKGIDLRCQTLFYPVIDANMNTESYEKFKNGPWLTKKAMEWFWNCYAPDKSVRNNKLLSPINASLDELSDMPPTLIITNEYDVLRDEGELYGNKLTSAGVDVISMRILNSIHDSMMLKPLVGVPSIENAINIASSFLNKWLKK